MLEFVDCLYDLKTFIYWELCADTWAGVCLLALMKELAVLFIWERLFRLTKAPCSLDILWF
jgi:hypothetical protein